MPHASSQHFINRELSWLEFNHRVLEEAQDESNPILERLKFLCIVSANLDEFFEVRIAGLKQRIESESVGRGPDGRTALETFEAAALRVREMVKAQYATWSEIRPELASEGIEFLALSQLSSKQLEWIDRFYFDQVASVLTPLGVDPAHPFPDLLNKSLNIIAELKVTAQRSHLPQLAIVQVPRILSRIVPLPKCSQGQQYVFLEEIIFRHLSNLFPGNIIHGHWCFRVTRNSELYIDEESAASIIKAVEKELFNRRKGAAVRLEVEDACPTTIQQKLIQFLNINQADVYTIHGPMDPIPLMKICSEEHPEKLKDKPFIAPVAKALYGVRDVFHLLRKCDVLLHHPYETFLSIIEFIEQAADDPNVLAIKQTLYRSGSDERIFDALTRAARKGKQVTVIIELKARFDEDNNIKAARLLEQEGVHVLYGMVGYKIHSKMCLIVRRDEDQIRRYVHLASGNYNRTTARIYTDLGILTTREALGDDVGSLFNLLTGICQFQPMKKLLVAPFNLHHQMLSLIQNEAKNARKGLPAHIIAKMNALVDPDIICALYDASQAGVKVQLIVRGICCLRSGVEGLSDNIEVRSIVGRFLEHSRIFYFENACRPKLYIGSADWMPRNFFNRIETVFPIEDGVLRDRVMNEVLSISLSDNYKSRFLQSDGSYKRPALSYKEPIRSSQIEFMKLAMKRKNAQEDHGRQSLPIKMKVQKLPPL